MSDIGDFIYENRGDYPEAFKFVSPGDAISGTVTRAAKVDTTSLDGGQETSLVIQLDDGTEKGHSVWVKPKSDLIRKLAAALNEAKKGQHRPTVQEGDKVTIRFDHTEPSGKPSPRKVFVVAYEAAEGSGETRPDPQDLVA